VVCGLVVVVVGTATPVDGAVAADVDGAVAVDVDGTVAVDVLAGFWLVGVEVEDPVKLGTTVEINGPTTGSPPNTPENELIKLQRMGPITGKLQTVLPRPLCPKTPEKMLRKELKRHFEQNLVDHFQLLYDSQQKSLQVLETTCQNELRRRDKEIQILQRKIKNETKIEWIIDGWSRLRNFVSSRAFHIGGCDWIVGIYTNGDDEDCRGYLSIYLFLEKGPVKGTTIDVHGRITLINHKFPKESIQNEFTTTFPQKAAVGWGERRAVEASRITEESGFLLVDKLYFVVDMIVKQVVVWV